MYHHTIQIFYEELLDGVGSISNLWEGHKASDQSLSRVRLFATPWIAARQASLSLSLTKA